MEISWISLFADVPAAAFEEAVGYWQQITRSTAGEPTGEDGEFVPLVPESGDPYLWLQRVGGAHGGWHPDLHVPDAGAATEAATSAGARVIRTTDVLVVLESPGGLAFCLYLDERPAADRQRPVPPTFPLCGRSLADQLCLDLPNAVHDAEATFWRRVTGWPHVPGGSPEFSRLNPPKSLPVQFLLQRLGDDDTGGVRAHLDLSADDPVAEVARHMSLGAQLVREVSGWTTLHDPAGLVYCVTHRRPLD